MKIIVNGQEVEIDGPGKDATINGQNTLEIVAGDNVSIDQQGGTLTISASGGVTQEELETALSTKQNTLTGTQGQVVGFDADGKTVAQDGGEVYSTEETRIGTWIDGKPLYRSIHYVTFPNGSVTWAKIADAPPNVDTATRLYGIAYGLNGYTAPLPQALANYSLSIVLKYKSEIQLYSTNPSYYGVPAYIYLEYTKTTDQATIDLPAMLSSQNRASFSLDTQAMPTAAVTAGTTEKTEEV